MGLVSGGARKKWKSERAFACGAATGCACCCGAVTRPYICLPPLRGSREPSLMNQLLIEYLPLVVFMGVALVIGLALMVAPFLVAVRNPDPEKVSAYECGFNAFDDARMKFDIRFYLVSILFIIFDLEVAFLFPWAVSFKEAGAFGFWSMMVFLGVLTIGFVYEWRKGALEWD
jgi:NADH-quinone oxidoreductase subunit A